jgi:hypothetical protein
VGLLAAVYECATLIHITSGDKAKNGVLGKCVVLSPGVA